MGIGSSQRRGRPKIKKAYPSNHHGHHGGGGAGHQRGLLKIMKLASTTQTIVPVKRHPPWQYLYDPRMWAPSMPAYAMPQPLAPMPMPMAFNNYAAYPHASRSQPVIAPQPVSHQGPMHMSQVPPMVAPYSTGVPMPPSYIQQAPSARPVYNNMEYPAPMSTGMANPIPSYGAQTVIKPGYFLTDWTGGGKLSPGFLGPPL